MPFKEEAISLFVEVTLNKDVVLVLGCKWRKFNLLGGCIELFFAFYKGFF
jgi:hypothetical protein